MTPAQWLADAPAGYFRSITLEAGPSGLWAMALQRPKKVSRNGDTDVLLEYADSNDPLEAIQTAVKNWKERYDSSSVVG